MTSCLAKCNEFTCNPRDAIRHSFTLVCVGKQPIRIVTTSGREIQIFRDGNWTEWISLTGALPTLCYESMSCKYNSNLLPFCCALLVVFFCVNWIEADSVTRIRWLRWLTEFRMISPNSTQERDGHEDVVIGTQMRRVGMGYTQNQIFDALEKWMIKEARQNRPIGVKVLQTTRIWRISNVKHFIAGNSDQSIRTAMIRPSNGRGEMFR